MKIKLVRPRQWSRRQAILFIIAFAALGTALLLKSLATNTGYLAAADQLIIGYTSGPDGQMIRGDFPEDNPHTAFSLYGDGLLVWENNAGDLTTVHWSSHQISDTLDQINQTGFSDLKDHYPV